MEQGIGLTFRPLHPPRVDLKDGDLVLQARFRLVHQINPSSTSALNGEHRFRRGEVDERRVNLTRFPLSSRRSARFFLQVQAFQFSAAS